MESIYGRVYPRLPVALQNAALGTIGWHNDLTVRGRGFTRLLGEYEARTFADPGAVRELRDARLRAFLLHAYETVPYYHELFDQAGLHPREISTLEDLASLPITSKADVQERRSEFLSSAVPRRRWKLERSRNAHDLDIFVLGSGHPQGVERACQQTLGDEGIEPAYDGGEAKTCGIE